MLLGVAIIDLTGWYTPGDADTSVKASNVQFDNFIPQTPKPDYDAEVLAPLHKAQAKQAARAEEARVEANREAERLRQVELSREVRAAEPVAPSVAGESCNGPYRDLGYQMALARGWAEQWPQISYIVCHESSWSATAQNTTSSACGIAQNINGCGAYPDPSPAGQINWMYNYFQTHCSAWQGKKYCYNGPAGAYAFKVMTGWY